MKSSDTLTGWRERRPPPLTIATLGPGTLLGGSYRLLTPLGSGGMGEIFLASHERLSTQFVVKVLSPSLISAQAVAQFCREAAVLAKLQHPNIVQLIDFNWTDSGLPYLVMEHLLGRNLEAALQAQREVGPGACLDVLEQVACGLYSAHCRGVVHGDLKPSNIMIVPCDGRAEIVKLIDFGVSQLERSSVEEGRMLRGTPEFMSPEQALGRLRDLSPASDEFSLGVIAYVLVSGRLPWTASASSGLLDQIVHDRPSPLPGGMAAVETVLLRAMAKRPGQRYSSTLAFVRALRRAMMADGLLHDRFAGGVAMRNSAETALPPPSNLEDGANQPPTAQTKGEATELPSSSMVTLGDHQSPTEDVAVGATDRPEDGADDYPLTVRVRRPPARHRSWRWAPIVIGALLGAAFGLAGPLLAADGATSFWKTMHLRAIHAAAVVIDESRQVLGHLSSRSGK